MLCIICSTACTVESVAERRLWEIQQDEALLDVESTPSGNAKRRVHSVTTEMVLCVFFLDFFWTRVWIWHCHRQQHHCCRIVGKPASQCICIHSIWDDQNCGFYKIWNEMRFAKGWVTEVNCENHSHSHTVIHVCFLHTRCATLPPVHDVPEIPGLDDFTVYLIMAGSFAAVDQIVCCIVCLLIGHFHKLLLDFSRIFTLVENLFIAPHLVVYTKVTLWRHGDLHVVRVDFGHLPGLRRVGQHCAHSPNRYIC